MLVILCFDNGDGLGLQRLVLRDIENIISPLRRRADNEIALEVDLSIGDLGLSCDAVESPL